MRNIKVGDWVKFNLEGRPDYGIITGVSICDCVMCKGEESYYVESPLSHKWNLSIKTIKKATKEEVLAWLI